MNWRRGASREQQIADLFAAQSQRIERLVEKRVVPPHYAPDGCSYAWGRLVERTDIDLSDGRAPGWVFQTALREAWHLASRDQAYDSIDSPSVERTAPIDQGLSPHDQAVAREKLELVNELAPRRREVLLMQAAGFSYSEMEQTKGLSPRSIDRYLSESRKLLRTRDRERSMPPAERHENSTPTAPKAPAIAAPRLELARDQAPGTVEVAPPADAALSRDLGMGL